MYYFKIFTIFQMQSFYLKLYTILVFHHLFIPKDANKLTLFFYTGIFLALNFIKPRNHPTFPTKQIIFPIPNVSIHH